MPVITLRDFRPPSFFNGFGFILDRSYDLAEKLNTVARNFDAIKTEDAPYSRRYGLFTLS